MSTTSLSALPSSLSALLSRYVDSSSDSSSSSTRASTSAATVKAGGALGQDPAYTLALGSKQSAAALVGYNQLAQLGTQFTQAVAAAATPSTANAGSVSVDVTQLAQAQAVVAGPFGDPDTVSLGSGTLTIQTGKVDTKTGSFKASGSAVSVSVGSGSLNDIAKAINASTAGAKATVVKENGGYTLHLTSTSTGTNGAFRVSGLADLAYDPATPQLSTVSTGQTALDATYAINGTTFTYGSNSGVPVAFATTATFTNTGTTSVPVSSLADSVASLVNAFNGLQGSIIDMADTNGSLAADVNLAAGLFKNLGDAATGTGAADGSFGSLADIGISVQKDGTLGVNSDTLAKAINDNPAGVKSLISSVSQAMTDAVSPYLGKGGSIDKQIGLLSSLAVRGPGLFDYLNGTTDAASNFFSTASLADMLESGSAGTGKTLSDYLLSQGQAANGVSSLLSGNSTSSSSNKTLVDYLNSSDESQSTRETSQDALLSLFS